MMGRSPAFLPTDRCYARNHMWALRTKDVWRCGLSAYAVRLLGDLRRLEWSAPTGAEVQAQQVLGTIEGSKAVSDLFAPAAGVLQALNPAVLADPSLLNSNLYDLAWLFDLRLPDDAPSASGQPIEGRDSLGPPAAFLAPQQYLQHLELCWPIAQRILKGQVAGPVPGEDTGKSG